MRALLLGCLAILTACSLIAGPPEIQATIVTADFCIPCRTYVAAVKKELPPEGWMVRDSTAGDSMNAHIVITANDPSVKIFPTTIIRRTSDGKEVSRIVGAITPTALAEAINKQRMRLECD